MYLQQARVVAGEAYGCGPVAWMVILLMMSQRPDQAWFGDANPTPLMILFAQHWQTIDRIWPSILDPYRDTLFLLSTEDTHSKRGKALIRGLTEIECFECKVSNLHAFARR